MLDGLGKYASYAPVLIRWFLGIGFVAAGTMKFLDLGAAGQMFSTWFGSMGPALAIFVAAVELLGGLALLLGVWARIAALLLSVVMLVAVIVTWQVQPNGLFGTLAQIFGMLPLAYLVLCIVVALRGAQKFALMPDSE